MRNSYFGQGGNNRSRSLLGPAYHEAKELDLHWTVGFGPLIDLWGFFHRGNEQLISLHIHSM